MAKFALVLSEMVGLLEGPKEVESESSYWERFENNGYLIGDNFSRKKELTTCGRELLVSLIKKTSDQLSIKEAAVLLRVYGLTTLAPTNENLEEFKTLRDKFFIHQFQPGDFGKYVTTGKGRGFSSDLIDAVKLFVAEAIASRFFEE